MAKITARTPKGMRDYLPADMLKREYVLGVIRDIFESYGFEPIDTPVLELRETLMSSDYGEDAEKLIFFAQHGGGGDEYAMRYDLTVPLSRFFASNENALSNPFRRYHIAPVWRGERPQKGRYREFYQCDADIVGVRQTSADAELMSIIYKILNRLGFEEFTIKYNDRKLLIGMGIYAGVDEDRLPSLYRIIDKTDKIGLEGVAKEFEKEGFPAEVIDRMMGVLAFDGSGDTNTRLTALGNLREELDGIEIALEGLQELEDLTRMIDQLGVPTTHTLMDFTMVRGLGYYTGPIFETIITKPDNLGSVQGGGRYDELIGRFRGQSLPNSGISMGIDRIIELMDMLDLYPDWVKTGTVVQTMVTVFNDETLVDSMKLAQELRNAGLRVETYLDARKNLGKQIGYADGKGIPVIAILGPDEIANGMVNLKRLADGEERSVARNDAAEEIKRLIAGG
ncbi:MAG: histidine--tRNA ligase [Chloroflexi bacterium]|nr:histidine--tRNA ligase [Chloroflexota bacterium]